MKMKASKAVVFDMDGVLFDTERVCRDSWVAVAGQYGITDMDRTFPQCIGRNRAGSEQVIRERYGEDFPYDEFREKASEHFWRTLEEQGPPKKKGVSEILAFLKENGWKVGLASSTARESVLRHLEKEGIADSFSVVVGGDQILHSKPDPDIYLLACRELGVDPGETFAIEDSYHGIHAANRAGMRPIMVPDLLPATEEMESLCEVIKEDLLQVKEYFENWQA